MDRAGFLASRRQVLLTGGGLALCLPRPGLGQAPPAAAPPPAEATASWPHQVSTAAGSATVYQPQVISWPGQTTLNARAAVSIARQGGAPVLGTVEITARTSTDFATRTVTLAEPRL